MGIQTEGTATWDNIDFRWQYASSKVAIKNAIDPVTKNFNFFLKWYFIKKNSTWNRFESTR